MEKEFKTGKIVRLYQNYQKTGHYKLVKIVGAEVISNGFRYKVHYLNEEENFYVHPDHRLEEIIPYKSRVNFTKEKKFDYYCR